MSRGSPEKSRTYYEKHRSRLLEKARNYRAANRERLKEYSKDRWAAMTPEERAHIRAGSRRRAGLPAPIRPCPEFCENCGGNTARALHLDHDHTTGRFRGWLCSECNIGIGKLGDNIKGLERAIAYIKRSIQ